MPGKAMNKANIFSKLKDFFILWGSQAVIFNFVAGTLADRLDKKRIMLLADSMAVLTKRRRNWR